MILNLNNNSSAHNPNELVKVDTVLWFGKYKGKTVKELLTLDPKYLQWAVDSNPNFKCTSHTEWTINQAVIEWNPFGDKLIQDDKDFE